VFALRSVGVHADDGALVVGVGADAPDVGGFALAISHMRRL